MILVSKNFLVTWHSGGSSPPLAVAPTSGWPNSQGPKQNISEMGFSEPTWPNSTPQGSEHPISDRNPYSDSAGVWAPISSSVHYILMIHNEIGFGLNSLCNQKSGLLKEKVTYIFATFKANKYFYQNWKSN